MENKTIIRYHNLDYLRGLCALSILLYHYVSWTAQGLDISNPLGKLGVYGVSLFYVLSGLTMYLVYFKSFTLSVSFLKNFYVKRFFRIYPLMWFVMIINLLLNGTENSLRELIVQFTGLFGVVDWAATVPVGMWSIGNELCFYLMLPLFFFCIKQGKVSLIFISVVTFGIYFYFAYFLFNKSYPISEQDYLYKNPLCQAALFLGGILIGHFFKETKCKNNFILIMLAIFILCFIFYPVSGNAIQIIAGNERVVYTFICFGITFCFFKADLSFISSYILKACSFLGEISYTLYLMHTHVWTVVVFTALKIRYVFPISIIATLVICYVIYRYIEEPARKFGAKLVSN